MFLSVYVLVLRDRVRCETHDQWERARDINDIDVCTSDTARQPAALAVDDEADSDRAEIILQMNIIHSEGNYYGSKFLNKFVYLADH